MEAAERIDFLFTRYINRQITDTEFDELLIWLYGLDEQQSKALSLSQQTLWEKAKAGELPHTAGRTDWNQALAAIVADTATLPEADDATSAGKPVRKLWPRMAAAAMLLLLLGAGILYISHPHNTRPPAAAPETRLVRLPENVLPNTNRTILTLGDGKQIALDSTANGRLAELGGADVVKLRTGEIVYTNSNSPAPVQYHIITVPRGGRPYRLKLADGSAIWLNAASSLRYPTAFPGKDRTVELKGEGYFEIAGNPQQPFHVRYNDMDVAVLGTRFGILAYEDEPAIATTLLEGAVQVSTPQKNCLLDPGKQALLDRDNRHLTVSPANTNMAVAWVNGYFQFDKTDVASILRQVSRWYDLDIVYDGAVHTDLFSGKIERNLPLTGIVRLLDQGNIHVRVEGKKLIVL